MSEHMNGPAILMPNWLGDCLLALSVIKTGFNNSNSLPTLIAPPQFIELINLLTPMPCIAYNRKNHDELQATYEEVQSKNFSEIYIIPHSFSSALFACRCKIPFRRGLRAEFRSFLLTDKVPPKIGTRKKHLSEEMAHILTTEIIPVNKLSGTSIDKNEQFKNCIVFCPGARYGPTKRWPGYRELSEIFKDENILIIGDDLDKDIADQISDSNSQRITNLCGKTSLVEVARIIAGAKAVISNDSGLMHLAGFLGVPVVGIFCSTSPEWTRPIGNKSTVAVADIKSRPCFRRECKYGHYNCHKLITPEHVSIMAKKVMEKGM